MQAYNLESYHHIQLKCIFELNIKKLNNINGLASSSVRTRHNFRFAKTGAALVVKLALELNDDGYLF